MTKYIFHEGSGTILDADDGVFIVDSNEVPFTIETEEDLIAAMDEYGKKFTHNDLSWSNCISYSPTASRSEADAVFNSGVYDETDLEYHALVWVLEEATDSQLNSLAHWILEDDDLWSQYRDNFNAGLTSFYEEVIMDHE